MKEPTRIAVISSPRSGNSWIRSVLAGSLNMNEIAVHNYLDAPNELPDRCFLQIHWYREPNFQKWLRLNDFKVVTIARNPFDILLSALHYSQFEPDTARWLEGNTGLPNGLLNATPYSKEFLQYALSFEAENLLSITYQWWHQANAIKLRYEDVTRDPNGTLEKIVSAFGGDRDALQPMLESISFEKMKNTPNRHGWQGRPGLWRELITPIDALKIWQRHRRIFQVLGYRFYPYWLSQKSAKKNWSDLA
jgi:hypothetical protein